MKKKLALLALISTLATPLHAQIFRLKVTDYGGFSATPTAVAAFDAEIAKAEAELNKDLPSSDTQRLMQGMADSSVAAGKGVGSDYASGMEVMLIGAGVGVGADLEKDKSSDSDISGLGVQPGLIIGMNLGVMDAQKILGLETDKLNVYLSGMSYNLDVKTGDNDKDQIEAKLTSFGFHASYDWIKGGGSKLFGWGGVKINTGYEYNRSKYSFTTTLNEKVDVDVGTGTVSGTIVGRPKAEIDVTTHSIPLEISSSVQFLYLFSLYGGLGADYNMGEAKGSGALNADPTTLDYSAGTDPEVQATANIDGKGKVTSFTGRAFAGVQLNLPFTRIFVQANKVLNTQVVSATAGLRFVY